LSSDEWQEWSADSPAKSNMKHGSLVANMKHKAPGNNITYNITYIMHIVIKFEYL
jgi:hypothetical protein